jgi:hypothetical protein
MYTNRRAILSLVAHGRITPAEAERLIAACSADREAWWMLAGCALCAGLFQLHSLTTGLQSHVFAGMAHLFRLEIEGSMHALHHVVGQVATLTGGNQ